MAINLWEQSGKPINYNPLPGGWGATIGLSAFDDFVMSFKAKSPTGATLQVQSSGKVYGSYVLTNELKEYVTPFRVSTVIQNGIFIYDLGSAGNIVIEDIKVVEKPLDKTTLNIIDGFKSGKWVEPLFPFKIIDDETIEHYTNNINQGSNIIFPVIPYTDYYASTETGKYAIANLGGGTSGLLGYGEGYRKFNSGNNTELRFFISNTSAGAGTFVYKRPMVAFLPVPYESKKGTRMVVPQQTEKNLFDKQDFAINKIQGTGSTYRYDMIVKPNTEYTLSTNAPFDVSGSANIYFNGTSTGIDGVQSGSPKTARSGGKGELYILVRYATNNAYQKVLDGEYLIQIEEGAQATSFEVQRNKVAIVGGTIGKNMFRGFEPGYLNSGTFNEKPLSGSNGQRTSLWMECEPGMKYALSGGDRSSWHFKNANGTIFAGLVGSDFGGVITPPNGAVLMRVYYSSDGTHGFPQIEKNEVTNYEKPVTAPKVAIKIPKKNMVKEDTVIMDATVTANVIHDETIKLEIGKTYTLSAIIPTGVTMQPRKEYTGGVYQNLNGNGSRQSLTFVATHEILVLRKYTVSPIGLVTVSEIQVEEGGNQTSFEKLTMVNKPSRKGLEFNSVTDRIGISNSATDTMSDKDFTIESVFVWYGVGLKNETQQTIFSCGDIRYGFSGGNARIGMYTPSTGWADAIPDNPIGREISLKATVTPTNVKIWVDGVLKGDKNYTGAIMAQVASHIGTLGGGSYWFNGMVKSLKIVSKGNVILDYDFTDITKNKGTRYIDKNGIEGNVYGSPVQYPRMAKR